MTHVQYVWDPIEDNVIRECDGSGNVLVDYTTEPTLYGSVISQDRGGQVRHYHYDGQGNTTELTDENGNVTDTRKYSAFGEVTESTGTTEFPYQWRDTSTRASTGTGHCCIYDHQLAHVSILGKTYAPQTGRTLGVSKLHLLESYNSITVIGIEQRGMVASQVQRKNTDKQNCEDWVKGSVLLSNLLDTLKARGKRTCKKVPTVFCVDCSQGGLKVPDEGGHYDCDKKEITICYEQLKGSKDKFFMVLKHEALHWFDHCCGSACGKGSLEWWSTFCKRSACHEIRAVCYSKACDNAADRDACIVAAATKSVEHHMQCKDSAGQYVREMLAKCSFKVDPMFPFDPPTIDI